METNFKTPSVAANAVSIDGNSLSAVSPENMSSKEKHYAHLKKKYGLDYKKREPTRLDDPEIGEKSPNRGITKRIESKDLEDVEGKELKTGFKYFLYHHHSFLGVFCVKHADGLPRYARFFLFLFYLQVNLLFALTLKDTGMSFAERLFLASFLSVAFSITMSILLKNCGFEIFMTGEGKCTELLVVFVMMVIPSAICITIIVVFIFRQDDRGEVALILFASSTVISLLFETIVWYVWTWKH
mmetsp:Transcript_1672/g.2416  ORF Transcript_1672/g.2416 Transcript_1672/m.2416 type:complete len:242 (+) Transcript_1672:110-835(+)